MAEEISRLRTSLRHIEDRAQSALDGRPSGGEWTAEYLRSILTEIRDAAAMGWEGSVETWYSVWTILGNQATFRGDIHASCAAEAIAGAREANEGLPAGVPYRWVAAETRV